MDNYNIKTKRIHGHGRVGNTSQCVALYSRTVSDKPGGQVFATSRLISADQVITVPIILIMMLSLQLAQMLSNDNCNIKNITMAQIYAKYK